MGIEKWSLFFQGYRPIGAEQCEMVINRFTKYGRASLSPGQCTVLDLMLAGF